MPGAKKLLANVSELFVAKGKQVVHLNLKKDKPSSSEIEKLIIGPTGNLRAPTLIVGKKMIVGFNDDMYQDVLG